MANRNRIMKGVLAVLLTLSVFSSHSQAAVASRRGIDVEIYSLQIFVNQAYQMALEGSGLVMIDQMGKGGIFGGLMGKRGRAMIEEARRIIHNAIGGEEMKQIVRDGHGDNPLTIKVVENAKTALEGIDHLTSYLDSGIPEPQLSQMHSMFTLLNHGMKMASDGANMIMLGRSGESTEARDALQRHGRGMMQDGRVFIIRLSDNETMRSLHAAGFTPTQNKAMGYLHQSIETSLKLIDRLARM